MADNKPADVHVDLLEIDMTTGRHWLDPLEKNKDKFDEIRERHRAKWIAEGRPPNKKDKALDQLETRAGKKTVVELWPEEGESREVFMDRCITGLSKCVGPKKAPRICGTKWRRSEKKGKKKPEAKAFVARGLTDDEAVEACGATCVGCDGADAPFDLREFDPAKHPRVGDAHAPGHSGGEFGHGGSGGGDTGGSSSKPDGSPGPGYSNTCWVDSKGVIHCVEVEDAARALNEDRKVELNQPHSVSVLLERIGEIAKDMIAKGEKAPTFNLCNVTVKGTNLFCVESKGIPRIHMPQLDDKQTEEFDKYLSKKYGTSREEQFASHLRATQSELNGVKVAGVAEYLRSRPPGSPMRRIIVSADDYILDGHHSWAAKIGLDAEDDNLENDMKMPVIRVGITITELLEEAEKFTGGKGKRGGDESAGGEGAKKSIADVVSRWAHAREYDPNEPRDDHGRWTDGGGDDDLGSMALGGEDRNKTPSTRKVDALRDEMGVVEADVPLEQRQALDMYTFNSSTFNNTARLGHGKDSVETQSLDKLVSTYKTPRDMTVYRTVGWTRTKNILDHIGDAFSDAGFMSTTLDKSKIDKPGSYIEIQVPKGSTAFPVGSLSNYPEEAEILFPRDSRLQIISHEPRSENTERFVARLVS